MFQSWFTELVSVLSEIAVGISAVVATIVGIFEFKRWRVKRMAKEKFELAMKIALLAQEFRDEFNWVRNPFTWRSEFAEGQKGDYETNGEARGNDEYFARANRLRSLQETVRNLRVVRREAELYLDEGIGKLIEPIEGAFRKLAVAINMYFSVEPERSMSNRRAVGWDDARDRSLFETVYGTPDDEIEKSVDAAVNALLEELKRYTK